MRNWAKDQNWIDGGPDVGPAKPHGVVTVEKDWWLVHSDTFAHPVVERHMFFPGVVRGFVHNERTVTEQLSHETIIPGVKTIDTDRSVETDAASMSLTINNQRLLPLGEVAALGSGDEADVTGTTQPARATVLGDPGYLTWSRGQTATSQGMWGFPDEQPIVYRRFGNDDLDFRMFGGTVWGDIDGATPVSGADTGNNDRSMTNGWSPTSNRYAEMDDIGGVSDYISNLFTYSQGWFGQPGGYPPGALRAPDERRGGARAFVTNADPIPDDGRPITGVQVWAMIGLDNATTPENLLDVQVFWQPYLKMYDPNWPSGDPNYSPGAPRMFGGGGLSTKANTTDRAYISSNIFREHPVTNEEWTVSTVNDLLAGDGAGGGVTDGFGLVCVTNAGADHFPDGTGSGEPYDATAVGALRIYSIWIEVHVGSPADSWAQVLAPNALLRTYEGYGDNGEGLESNLAEGNLVQTGTWLIDEVHVKSDGELEIRCRDMAKLLITQKLYPPLVPYDQYPIHWNYNFLDAMPVANRTTPGLGGGAAGTYGPGTWGYSEADPPPTVFADVASGNFRDWTELIRWCLLWSGWWLSPLTELFSTFDYSEQPGYWPTVYGNLENTNSHPDGAIDDSIMNGQPVINAITTIKENVGFLFRIDAAGAARFEPPNFWTPGNFLDDGTHVPPDEKMYVIDEERQLTAYSVSTSDDAVFSEIVVSSNSPTAIFTNTVSTHYLTPNADRLRGIIRPWVYPPQKELTSRREQQRMAELTALHFWFAQRQSQVSCLANPAIDIDDQVLVFERVTSETTIHYVRGVSTHHDLESGDYTMQLVTNWLGTPEEWQHLTDFKMSSDVAEWLNAMDTRINRADSGVSGGTSIQDGKVTRGGGFTVETS